MSYKGEGKSTERIWPLGDHFPRAAAWGVEKAAAQTPMVRCFPKAKVPNWIFQQRIWCFFYRNVCVVFFFPIPIFSTTGDIGLEELKKNKSEREPFQSYIQSGGVACKTSFLKAFLKRKFLFVPQLHFFCKCFHECFFLTFWKCRVETYVGGDWSVSVHSFF